jgi:hypothetical protein
MRRIFLLLLTAAALSSPSAAQIPASSTEPLPGQAARAFAELDSVWATPRARLWGRTLGGAMMFVDPSTRAAYGNRPGLPTLLPDSVAIANTSVLFNGIHWSMVRLPLPADRTHRLDLLLHESFHRIQDSLGLPASDPTLGYLDTREGRTLLRLELRALAAAVSKPIGERRYDLQNALAFRARRYALHPGEDSLEHALEWNEGLAEFTGVYASGADRDTDYLPGIVRADTVFSTFTRSFAYLTGPLYGVLLSQRQPDWPQHITQKDNFADLIRRVYGLPAPAGAASARQALPPAGAVSARQALPPAGAASAPDALPPASAYQGDAIRAQEAAREARHLAQGQAYRKSLVQGPVLMITLDHMRISFNPSNLFDLGAEGTVYPTMTIGDAWGTLKVTGGALMKDWRVVRVPLGADTLRGPGWELTLNPGWRVVPDQRAGDRKLMHDDAP